MGPDRYALTYRAAEMKQVMSWLKAGQSGCLIGLRGAGKSNFLRFLQRPDIQQQYLGTIQADLAFIYIDLLALTNQTEWAVYELLLNRLLGQLRMSGDGEDIAPHYQEVVRTRDPLMAQRLIEHTVANLCRQPQQKLALLFDEFDAGFGTLDPSLFRYLRAIRDTYKDQISYIVIVTDDLAYLRDDLAEVEHFYRLVSRNVCSLGVYSEADARQMLCYLASRRSMEFSEQDAAYLVQQSGGHAGLLKSILSQLWAVPQESDLEEIVPLIQEEPTVQAECRKVWASLSETEQIALNTLLIGGTTDPLTLRRLQRKGLIQANQGTILLFSPVFADFVRQQFSPSTKETLISRSPRRVQLEGRPIETLTELEFDLLCYLYENRERVCTKHDLIANIYRQQHETDGGTDQMLQQLVSRLRHKIEPNHSRPRYIVTIRREGYKFVEPNE